MKPRQHQPENTALPLPQDVSGFFFQTLPGLLENSLVYPGSGTDLSPIRQFRGEIDSFLLLDYDQEPRVVHDLLMSHHQGARHGLVQLQLLKLHPLTWPVDWYATFDPRGNSLYQCTAQPAVGFLGIYEDPANSWRFHVLSLRMEAMSALAALYLHFQCRPRVVVIQEHGLGGNCWGSFGDKFRELDALAPGGFRPEMAVIGHPNGCCPWEGNHQHLGDDLAVEAMHRNHRSVLRLDPLSERGLQLPAAEAFRIPRPIRL